MSDLPVDAAALQKSSRPCVTPRAAGLKKRVRARPPRKSTSGGNLVYAGYPYDPYV
jgi:hypothetical protein